MSHVANRPRWDDHDWSPLPPLPADAEAELVVVGLGGTGLSAISEALDLGVKSVIGVDAVDAAAGAAGRNGGLLLHGPADFHHDAVEKHGVERTLAITALTEREMARIQKETPGVVRVTGSLRIAEDAKEFEDCRKQFESMRADGLAVEMYEGPEGRGLLFPGDGVMQPMRRARLLATSLRERGALLYGGTVARSIEPGRVRTEYGNINCKHVIVCVDGKLEWLFPELLAEVRTARLQMIATDPQTPVKYTRPVSTRYGFDYWQQLPDGTVLLGGGRDKFEDNEWTTDDAPDERVQDYLTDTLRNKLGISAPITHRWAASVSFTDSGLPVARQLGGSVIVCGAYSGTGNLVGAVCGRGAAQLALKGDSSTLDHFQD
jgi:glycine/D-amino acid oxidase-like deaminating enzyme